MSYYNWTEIMGIKADTELKNIIRECRSEPDDKVAAALSELKKRGIDVTDYEQFVDTYKSELVQPDDPPTLYSKTAVFIFTLIGSLIFGGVLFALNLSQVNKKKGLIPLLITLFILFQVQIFFYIYVPENSFVPLFIVFVGALLMTTVFWDVYIGSKVRYHRRSIGIPLLIFAAIFIPLIALVIWSIYKH